MTGRSAAVGPDLLWAVTVLSTAFPSTGFKIYFYSYGMICADFAVPATQENGDSIETYGFIGTTVAGREQAAKSAQFNAQNLLGDCSVPPDTSPVATERNTNDGGSES